MTSESPVHEYLRQVHARHASAREGTLATYIPELSRADPAWFGISLVTADGAVYEVGETRREFSIQSISKPFTFGVALDDLGPAAVLSRVGVEPTGDAFNSISLDPTTGMPSNPMVNAGAITVTGLLVERLGDAARDRLLDTYAGFAGRRLSVDEAVYESERATAHRNRAIAHLLRGSGALRDDPERALDVYLQQCSTLVDGRDLAVMAATLANGGVNPLTGGRVASPESVGGVLSVMGSCGMYDTAGDWLYTVGLPAKSGVSGGIIAVLPGRVGIAVFSPPIDAHGNSVRGVAVCRQLAADLGLHLVRTGHDAPSPIRSFFTLTQVGSKRWRPDADVDVIARRGGDVVVAELQGELDFVATELVGRRILDAASEPRFAVLDLRRASVVHDVAVDLTARLAARLAAHGGRLVITGAREPGRLAASNGDVLVVDDLDRALEWCEDQLLGPSASVELVVPLREHQVVAGMDDDEVARLAPHLLRRSIPAGSVVTRRTEPLDGLFLIVAGQLSVLIGVDGRPAHRLATLAGGMLLGERAVAGALEAAIDVIADTDVECLVLPTAALDELRVAEPEIWAKLMANVVRSVATRIDRLYAELAVLAE
jgi:glutaminase